MEDDGIQGADDARAAAALNARAKLGRPSVSYRVLARLDIEMLSVKWRESIDDYIFNLLDGQK